MNSTPTARVAATLIAAAVLLSGCGSDEPGDSATPTAAADIAAETASFDLAAGVDQRYLLGLFATEGGSIIDGTITLDFETLDDQAVTVRERDTMSQERISLDAVTSYFAERFVGC